MVNVSLYRSPDTPQTEVMVNEFTHLIKGNYFLSFRPLGYDVILSFSPHAIQKLIKLAKQHHFVEVKSDD